MDTSTKKRRSRKAKPADPFAEKEAELEAKYREQLERQRLAKEQGPPADVRERLGLSGDWKPYVDGEGKVYLDADDYYRLQYEMERVHKLHAQIERLETEQIASDNKIAVLDAQLRAAIQQHQADKRDRDAKLAELKADLIKAQSEELPAAREDVRAKYGLGAGQIMVGDDRSVIVDNETKGGATE